LKSRFVKKNRPRPVLATEVVQTENARLQTLPERV
jgi:hypothetical protein